MFAFRHLALAAHFICCAPLIAQEPSAAEKQFAALSARYRAAREMASTALEGVTDAATRLKIYQERDPANRMVGDFLKFEEAHRGTQAGLSALHHLVVSAAGHGFAPEYLGSDGGRQALKTLADHYLDHPDLDALIDWMNHGGDDAQSLLRSASRSSPHRHVRGCALMKMAEISKVESLAPVLQDSFLELLATDPQKYADRIELFTKARRQWTADPHLRREQTLRLLLEIKEQYADVLEPPRTGYGPILLKIERSENDALTGRKRRTLGQRVESMQFQLQHLSVGQAAPEIAGPDALGNELKLSDQRGKVTVIMFSFKGCGPCEAMYPGNRKLLETYRDRPFAFLGVMGDEVLATVKESISNGTITWPVWWDGTRPGPIANRWNVTGWPDVYVLDQKGVIRYGPELTSDLLELAVAKLMKEADQQP